MFLQRVVTLHPDILAMQERFPEEFTGFLRNLVLFEPDTQLYLLDASGTVLVSTGEAKLPPGFKVALAPVLQAAGKAPMPYVLGDDPDWEKWSDPRDLYNKVHYGIEPGEPLPPGVEDDDWNENEFASLDMEDFYRLDHDGEFGDALDDQAVQPPAVTE